MLIVIDVDNKKMYEVIKFSNIKNNDYYITSDSEIHQATEDYPENNGSFILRFVKEV